MITFRNKLLNSKQIEFKNNNSPTGNSLFIYLFDMMPHFVAKLVVAHRNSVLLFSLSQPELRDALEFKLNII